MLIYLLYLSEINLEKKKLIHNTIPSFNIRIYYPPSKEDKRENNRINQLETLFPSGIMTPSIKKGACCDCGNLWIQKPKVSDCESQNVHIHHSKSTADSRNGTLFLLYLVTKKCKCQFFYDGQADRLLRINKARKKHRPGTIIHFVSYDLLNAYYEQQMLGGQSQDSYIRSLNSLNKDFRGSSTSIPIRIFNKAVEIFMHSLVYDKELAFSCEKCPNPLKVGEREEDFKNMQCY